MTRGQRVIAFIEKYCIVFEGDLYRQPMRLDDFQKKFITDVYDNPHGTSRAYLSIARKNGKTALIAALLLAHIVGPEAVENSQIASGARSRKQAGLVYDAASKMIDLHPSLAQLTRRVPSSKKIIGLAKNVEYFALSKDADSNHGLSLVLAIIDEVGQVKGPHDAFVEMVETSQGAYDNSLLLAISTQAATDGDLFSIWLDAPDDPHVIKHLYTADVDCELFDEDAWRAANPALGKFRSTKELERMAQQAHDLPSKENSFRWLYLNQRINADNPFISKGLWQACGGEIADWQGQDVYGGLDLSSVADLTAFVITYQVEGVWHMKPWFWLPQEGLAQKSLNDRVPYTDWAKLPKDSDEKFLQTSPGPTIQYEWVAERLFEIKTKCNLKKIGFDKHNYAALAPWLRKAGFTEDELYGDNAIFEPFGQGYISFSPALRIFEERILNKQIRHGMNPPLNMCMINAVIEMDAAGNRKLAKNKSSGRIDGAVAAAMAIKIADTYYEETPLFSYSFG
ncbi:terminase TerL endonuclease subunit [Aureimonas altamirensis]|uniref:terminase TerL endonuclease subunit n=1 Tax=Aureimonas altamirensis TaxID=370622 RepID=UPI00301B2FBE